MFSNSHVFDELCGKNRVCGYKKKKKKKKKGDKTREPDRESKVRRENALETTDADISLRAVPWNQHDKERLPITMPGRSARLEGGSNQTNKAEVGW